MSPLDESTLQTITCNALEYRVRRLLWRPLAVESYRFGVVDYNTVEDMVYELNATLCAAMEGSKEIELPKPRFLDWLLGRRRRFKITFKDVLVDPPDVGHHKTLRLATIQPLEFKR